VVVVVVVSFRAGAGEEEEKKKQPDSNVDATINTLSFLSIDVFTPVGNSTLPRVQIQRSMWYLLRPLCPSLLELRDGRGIRSNFKTMNKDFDYLTQAETKRLFAAITNKRDRAIFLTAYRHGL
jgi:hypothetical protein